MSKELIYVGTFSERESEGIYVFELHRETRQLNLIQTIESKKSPTFLAIHPNGKYLFSVNREAVGSNKDWGSVTSFSINQNTGRLTVLNETTSYGTSPCHISIYPQGNWLFISHYETGNLVILPVTKSGKVGIASQNLQLTGSSIHPERQTHARTHSTIPSFDGRHLYVADLGIDKVMIYNFYPKNGTVQSAKQPWIEVTPGAGPRHFTIHPNSEYAFLAEEMTSTVNAFKVDPNDGSLTSYARLSTLPNDFEGYNSTADIHINTAGTTLYVSNRGLNSIAIFEINPGNGEIKFRKNVPSGGEFPRNFLLEPQGQFAFVANRNSDNVVLFEIDQSGNLTETATQVMVPSAVCIKYLEITQ